MLSMLDIATDIGITMCSIGAIIYGYWRWRVYHEKKDMLWYLIGVLMFIGVTWDYTTRSLITSIDPQLLFWSRNVLAAIIILACIAIYKRFTLE